MGRGARRRHPWICQSTPAKRLIHIGIQSALLMAAHLVLMEKEFDLGKGDAAVMRRGAESVSGASAVNRSWNFVSSASSSMRACGEQSRSLPSMVASDGSNADPPR